MQTKSILAVAAIAVAASTMAVSAEEPARPSEQTFHRFIALTGIHVTPMQDDELAEIRGEHWVVNHPGGSKIIRNSNAIVLNGMTGDTSSGFWDPSGGAGPVTFTTNH